MRTSSSIVPRDDDQDVYFVMDDLGRLGRVWRETDPDDTERETVIRDMLEGQFSNPVRVVAFNTVKAGRGMLPTISPTRFAGGASWNGGNRRRVSKGFCSVSKVATDRSSGFASRDRRPSFVNRVARPRVGPEAHGSYRGYRNDLAEKESGTDL